MVLFTQPSPEPVQAGISEHDVGVGVDVATAVLLLIVASELLDVEGVEALQLAVVRHRQEAIERRQVDGKPPDDVDDRRRTRQWRRRRRREVDAPLRDYDAL